MMLSALASGCVRRQRREALELAVTCRLLSGCFRKADDPLMAVALGRLADELRDQASVLLPMTPADDRDPDDGPAIEADVATALAELDVRLARAAVVAQSDAMSPGLEPAVAALLWGFATLYHTRRELLLLCELVDACS